MSHIDHIPLDSLPRNIRYLVNQIGITKAMAVVDAFPGVTLALSMGIRSDGQATFAQVAEIIGEDDARKLAKNREGEPLYIPGCVHINALREARDAEIRQKYDMLIRTYSVRAAAAMLALEYKLCDRQIFNIVNNSVSEPKNRELFA